jgi:hypothetical protein
MAIWDFLLSRFTQGHIEVDLIDRMITILVGMNL